METTGNDPKEPVMLQRRKAERLLELLGTTGRQEPPPETIRHRFRILCAKTGVSGIGADTYGTVTYREPISTGWDDATQEYTAWNLHPTVPVAADTIVLIAPVNGRWVVIYEAC